jgi:hypothetical protein
VLVLQYAYQNGFLQSISVSVMGGWLNSWSMPSRAQLSGVLTQWGGGVSGGFIVGGGFYGNDSGTATNLGLITPGVFGYAGYTWQLSGNSPGWCN